MGGKHSVLQMRAKGICPEGWHIPTLSELQILSNIVKVEVNALKAVGQGSGDGAGTNTSGFSALLVGFVSTMDTSEIWITTLTFGVPRSTRILHILHEP
ncbi:MAG: fibrobacter succinogenes major paralogous domain-containing protein [Ignavibacteriales bacterium]|nr:fibrobacter succinogenes major paralogous domain-containing protein [Ignavibacteriales bacterium]